MKSNCNDFDKVASLVHGSPQLESSRARLTQINAQNYLVMGKQISSRAASLAHLLICLVTYQELTS